LCMGEPGNKASVILYEPFHNEV